MDVPSEKVGQAAVIRVGCAGWSMGRAAEGSLPAQGTHLERYAAQYNAVEINSSFYRPHRPETYSRWAASTPDDFRFAVKAPKTITHVLRLQNIEDELIHFLAGVENLGRKLGPLLFQLPPRLAFHKRDAESCFSALRKHFAGAVVCEPRHKTWFAAEVTRVLESFRIARVSADPAIVADASIANGPARLQYYRWHGSPQIYYSSYDLETLRELSESLLASAAAGSETWCIFDNTASGAALVNARELVQLLQSPAVTMPRLRSASTGR